MMSEKLTKELQDILCEDFGMRCDTQEATEIGNSLVNYFDTILKINHKNYEYKNTIQSD